MIPAVAVGTTGDSPCSQFQYLWESCSLPDNFAISC